MKEKRAMKFIKIIVGQNISEQKNILLHYKITTKNSKKVSKKLPARVTHQVQRHPCNLSCMLVTLTFCRGESRYYHMTIIHTIHLKR